MKGCRVLFPVIAVVMATALSGCSGLFQKDTPADQAYMLRAAPAPAAATSPANRAASLRIGRTLTAPGLEGDRILLLRGDYRVDYYAGSRWIAAVPQMVEDLAAETLRRSGFWSSVHDSQGAFPTEYFLQLDIRRFEADYTEGADPKIHVVLGCTLGRRTERDVLTNFVAEGSAPAAANRMSAVVAAFEEATQAALAAVVERSSQAVSASGAK